jgi:hypothetical protein
VVIAFLSFVVETEIDQDESSAIASCEDLSNFASHRVSSLAPNRGTQVAHSYDIKLRIFSLIELKMAYRP